MRVLDPEELAQGIAPTGAADRGLVLGLAVHVRTILLDEIAAPSPDDGPYVGGPFSPRIYDDNATRAGSSEKPNKINKLIFNQSDTTLQRKLPFRPFTLTSSITDNGASTMDDTTNSTDTPPPKRPLPTGVRSPTKGTRHGNGAGHGGPAKGTGRAAGSKHAAFKVGNHTAAKVRED